MSHNLDIVEMSLSQYEVRVVAAHFIAYISHFAGGSE